MNSCDPNFGIARTTIPLTKLAHFFSKSFFDIDPKNNLIQKVDFLKWRPTFTNGKIHVIGNPPFGKQSSLCHKFFKHSDYRAKEWPVQKCEAIFFSNQTLFVVLGEL